MNKQYKLTKSGIAELRAELEQLKAQKPVIAERIKSARELGDLSENAEYSSAMQEKDSNDARTAEIEHILMNAEEISQPKKKDEVEMGNTVELTGTKGNKTFTIVGSVEADPLEGKVSNESPIGQALLGKKLGEKVEIKLPAGTTTYTIKSIK